MKKFKKLLSSFQIQCKIKLIFLSMIISSLFLNFVNISEMISNIPAIVFDK